MSNIEHDPNLADRLTAMVESSPEVIVGLRAGGEVEFWNAAAENLFGIGKEQVIGQAVSTLLSIIDTNDTWTSLLGAADEHREKGMSGQLAWRELQLQTPQGKIVRVELALDIYRHGNYRYATAYVRDVGGRKKMEQGARQADTARINADFLTNISDEIRTPMNDAIGMLDLLLDTTLSDAQSEFAAVARNSAERLSGSLAGILDFSRIEAGQLNLESVPFDLFAEIETVLQAQAIPAQNQNLNLIMHYPPAFARRMRGDPTVIRQVLSILVGNAVKFTVQGEVVVDVDVTVRHGGRCHVLFSVSDTGIGLEARKIPGIFDKFTHVEAKAQPLHEISGLGLTVCKLLVELMGGHIGVDRQLERGSTFWVSLELPLIVAECPAQKECALNGVRVLLIEDDLSSRHIWGERLLHEGMRADTFGCGMEALAALQKAITENDPYRVALIGAQMSDIDGVALGTAIKSEPAFGDTLLVLLGTRVRANDARDLAQAGFSAFLKKPLTWHGLLHTLHVLCTAMHHGEPPSFQTGVHFVTPRLTDSRGARPFDGSRILVVVDHSVNHSVVMHMLERLGCATEIAGDGLQAAAMLQVRRFDLILMDCHMPSMGSRQAAALIRAAEAVAANARVPIVALMAHALTGERTECMASGIDDFLPQPIRLDTLRNVLGHWLQTTPVSRPVAENMPQEDDLDAMQEMFGSDFAELVSLFQTDCPKRIAALHSAVADGNPGEVARVVHVLSGSAASMGARSLAFLCKTLEAQIKSGLLDNLAAKVEAIEADYVKIDARLRSMLQAGER